MPRTRRPTRAIAGELAVIEAIRRQASAAMPARGALRVGIGDDCAVLRPSPGHEICVTTDFSLETVHFRRDWHPPQSAGHRCLARGLSDLAAMGADPLAVFLSLAAPRNFPAAWLQGFLDGFLALAAVHHVPLAGGDTAQSPSAGPTGFFCADIVAVGQTRTGEAIRRSGARPGDLLYVTGTLGGSAAELLALGHKPEGFRRIIRASAHHPHLYPEPRLEAGRRLRRRASAMIDISDGLSTDLTHLCTASGVAAVVHSSALPLDPLAVAAERRGKADSAMELALHGGEDYELLFTAAPNVRIPRQIAGVAIHRIGEMRKAGTGEARIILLTVSGPRAVKPGGWEHFRSAESASAGRKSSLRAGQRFGGG